MTECVICAKPFTPYRPQQRCCGPDCRKRHVSAAASARKRALRRAVRVADASEPGSGGRRSGAPGRLQGVAIVPNEQQPIRTAKMTDEEFAAEYARSKREILDRGGLLIDRGWRERMANRKGGGE